MSSVLTRFCCTFAVLTLSLLVGCGGKEEKKEAGPKPASERILGMWEGRLSIDDEALEKNMKDDLYFQVLKQTTKESEFEEESSRHKENWQKKKIYFSFQDDGSGRVGEGPDGQVDVYNTMTWRIEKEEEARARIAIKDSMKGKQAQLDATFQDDGTILAKVIQDGKAVENFSAIHLKRIEKLPFETN